MTDSAAASTIRDAAPPVPIPSRGRRRLRPVRRTMRFAGPRTVAALILREMVSSYGRSPGGYAWLIIEPVLGILFITAFFMLVGLRTPALGTNFGMFMATGMLPFTMFTDLSNKTAQSINYSRALLAYPRVTYIDAILARTGLAVLTNLLVTFLLLTGIRMIWETRTVVVIEPILLSLTMAVALGVGMGLLNCFLFTRFQIWQRVWSIATRPLFFISGILILYESIPAPWNGYFIYNPLIHVTASMRAGFYVGYEATYVDPGYVFLVSGILGLWGLLMLHRFHRDLLEL
ncbi:ABC transporter permease [Wenxinia marina]|uniref:ABC-type polysaccharide/polyol phosphate export system, permease component n=1 Tax=Wenxinia marina DSM 24838 TaxID=1123501 RepID=A0A0D0QK93_9RHOB|nr:ABC transporter permease [Wenxinia marina]KIQ71428.1 ABC-type polysaccharide/polyol phosphate export system, permease component [Wenxinia marina DSM 24838]GGL78933.1 transport permease protein [Wenxinia marina]